MIKHSPPPQHPDFQDKVPLCSLGCPRAHSVDQAGLELTEIHLPLPPERWEACTTTAGLKLGFYFEVRLSDMRTAILTFGCCLPDLYSPFFYF